MTTASHYVIEDVLKAKGDKEAFVSVFKKFVQRYSDDREFVEIYNKFKDSDAVDSACAKLEEMAKVRRVEESGGGTNLPYKDRRDMHD